MNVPLKRMVTLTDALGPLQLKVMRSLWRLNAATVAQVHTDLSSDSSQPYAYTTVLTVLRNLHRRGAISRTRLGKRDQYVVVLQESEYQREIVRILRREIFSDDLAALANAIAREDEKQTTDDLK